MAFNSETGRAAGSKPKKRDFLTQHLIAELNEVCAGEPEKARMLVRALINKAMDGDVSAAREVFDRIEGKPPQAVQMSGPDGEAIVHRIERVIIDSKT